MNTTYLLITLIVLALAIWSVVKSIDNESPWLVIAILLSFGFSGLFVSSFAGSTGYPTTSLAPPDRIEHTAYRVVVTSFGAEQTYTDAYTVANVASITQVRRTVQHNAWGIELEKPYQPTYELVFKGATP